jgi:hypothetical protein
MEVSGFGRVFEASSSGIRNCSQSRLRLHGNTDRHSLVGYRPTTGEVNLPNTSMGSRV